MRKKSINWYRGFVIPRISVQQIGSAMACVALCLGNASAGQLRGSQQKPKPVDKRPVEKGTRGPATKSKLVQVPLNVVAIGTTPKVAQYENGIYVVFADQGKIWLVTSGNGIVWTSRELISGTDPAASNPAIVMLEDGTRIITWKTGNSLRYSFRDLNPCQLASGLKTFQDSVDDYDIVKAGGLIHLVINDSSSIRYASFPGQKPPATISETIEAIPLCGGNSTLNHPRIAARNTKSGLEVVVAYYLYLESTCAASSKAGPLVVKRTSPFNWTGLSGFSVPISPNPSLVTTPQPYSMSLDVDDSGVYFLTASDIVNSVSRVMLTRGTISSAWDKNTTTYAANLSKAISVSARQNYQGYFNLAYTWLHLPPNYDETSKEVGFWPLSSPAPSWGGPLLLDANGKNARATNIAVCNSTESCVVTSIFERKVGSNSEIVSDAVCGTNGCPTLMYTRPPCR